MKENKVASENNDVLIRVVDDNETTSRSLAFFLEALGYQVKVWNDSLRFMEEVSEDSRVGCIILDIRMPSMNGMEVQKALSDRKCSLPIIFLTGHGDVDMAVSAVKKGAFDFLQKPPSEERLLTVLEEAVRKSTIEKQDLARKEEKMALFNLLTEREKDVIRLVAKGKLNKVVAYELGISEKTVQQHRGMACRKMKVRNLAEIIELLDEIGELEKEERS